MINRWIPLLMVLALGCVKTKAPETSEPIKPTSTQVKSAPANPALQRALVGVWVLDLDALSKDPELAKLPPKAHQRALAVATDLMKGTRIRFDQDGKLSMIFGKSQQSGTWRVTAAAGETLTIEANTTSKQGLKTELIKALIRGDHLRITGTDGQSLDLVRDLGNPNPTSPAKASPAKPAAQ